MTYSQLRPSLIVGISSGLMFWVLFLTTTLVVPVGPQTPLAWAFSPVHAALFGSCCAAIKWGLLARREPAHPGEHQEGAPMQVIAGAAILLVLQISTLCLEIAQAFRWTPPWLWP